MMKKIIYSGLMFFLLGLYSTRLGATMTLSASNEVVTTATNVCIDVSVADFNDIVSMQFSMNYNTSVLEFTEVVPVMPDLNSTNFGIYENDGGLAVAWTASNPATGESLDDGSVIFSVCFDVVGAGGFSGFTFGNDPVAVEVYDVDLNEVIPTFNNGSVTYSPIGLSLYADALVTDELCGGQNGAITINAGGGMPPYAYDWGFATTANITNLASGTYSVTVTDSDGATVELTSIVANQQLEVTEANIIPESCDQSLGVIHLTTNGNNPDFLWSNGATTSSITQLTAGDYSVTITEGDCSIVETYTIQGDDGIAAYSYECDYQNGTTELYVLLWCGGAPPYTFTWSTGEVTTNDTLYPLSSILIDALATDTYGVTITDELGFYLVLDDMEVDCGAAPLTIEGQVTQVDCDGQDSGIIETVVSGGIPPYTYAWSNGADVANITGLAAGVYTLTVTDSNGSSTSASYTVNDGIQLSYFIDCSDLDAVEISATAFGGIQPLQYVWSNGDVTTGTEVEDLVTTSSIIVSAGDYYLTVSDAFGCATAIEIDANCTSSQSDFFLSITPESSQLAEGESMCVDVTTADFLSIASMQFTINWDESVLQLDEISNIALDGLTENNFNQPDDGTLLLSWLDNNLTGVSLPDESALFSLCFTAIGTGTSNIEFSNDPVEIEVVRADLSIASVATADGTVTVGGNSGMAVLNTTEAVGVQGETVCTAVQLDNAQDIVGTQFSMHWDADALDLQSIENFLFDGSATIATTFSDLNTAAEEGTLLFSFTDVSTINGYNFNQATTLFELCYDIAAPSGQYPIIIDGTPNPIELIDSDLNLLSNVVDTAAVIVVDAIWPGDTNQDGLVNQYDVLNIGLAYGATGPLRVSPLNWAPYPGDDWGMSTAETDVEFKHIDTDGNGSIQAADTVAMAQNWFETNHLWDGHPSPFDSFEEIRDDNTPFYIEQDTVSEGQEIVLNIILGDESTMAEDVYGLAFTIDYDETLVERNSAWAAFENSWIGDLGQDMLTFYRDDYENGKIRIGMTRTDGMNISGSGMIGQVGITILDVIFRDNLVPMEFSIENPVIINYSEQQIPVSPSSTTSYVITTDVVNRGLEQQLKVYPTVTDGLLKIESGDVEVLQLQLFQANGSFVSTMNMADHISVKDLNEGYYYIKFITDKGVAVKEFIKL